MSLVLFLLLSGGVHRNLPALSQWGIHLREKTPDITSDFGVSGAFKCIVDGIPALLHCATGCDKRRLALFRLIAVATNVRVKLRLDVGGRVALNRAKNAICFWNSRLAAHR